MQKLVSLSFLLGYIVLSSHALGQSQRPNILYIYSDDQSYRTVSCYPRSYNFANTPNIDRLAEQGVRFDQAYIGAKCVPSRATALTGRLQFAVESNYDGSDIPGSIHWFPTLRANGYYTGMIGKWHYGRGASAHQHGTSWDWSVVWDHGAYAAAGGYYYDQKVMINGAPQVDLNGYSTDRYTDYTEQFIQERADDPDSPPWFYWLAYAGVHGPYTPADRHIGMLDDEPEPEIPVDIYGPRPGKPIHFQDTKWTEGAGGKPFHRNKTLEFWVKQQTEAVASIDDSIGRILDKLEATGQLENTIIIFTSDQGYVWGHHGLKGKIDPYESAIRSPFIVSNPARFPQGKVSKAPINGPDVIRTFHAWADAEPQLFMPGRDITPVIENPESEAVLKGWAEVPTMMTYVHNRYEPTEIRNRLQNEEWSRLEYDTDTPYYFMILVENYKYTRYASPDRIEELYDLDADPEELNNLAIQPQFKSKVLEMRAACTQSIKDNGGLVFADLLPTPTTADYWPPNLPASDNAHALDGSGLVQDDSETLRAGNGWGQSDSRLAYLRFNLSGPDLIDGHPADLIRTTTLDLWMTQTEGDAANELQVFALLDGAKDSAASLSETNWTSSSGGNPLLGTNLPHGDADPAGAPLTSVLLGSHSFAASGDNNERGLVQIPLSIPELRAVIDNDTNGEITLILRSTSTGLPTEFASLGTTVAGQSGPALTVVPVLSSPENLNALGGDGRVTLNWDDSLEAEFDHYRVYRSTTSDDYLGPLATNLTSNEYIDEAVVNGTSYFYTVTAVDSDAYESDRSNEAVATPAEFSLPSGTILFGTDHEGLAGFTQSSTGSGQSWSMQAESVRYRNQNNGTRNSSLLREFTLDRSVGASYMIKGVIYLNDGYADDNNRTGIYLFGDQADLGVAPGEDETGALCLLLNFDTGDLRLVQGIDNGVLVEENTGRGGDNSLFGHEIRLTAEISFQQPGTTKQIEIIGSFIDELGEVTQLNHTVDAANYSGDWFGFATRARSRDYGSGGAKSAPFVMDYRSFFLSDPLSDYEQWAEDFGIGSEAFLDGDYDGDGASNLDEYGLGGNPNNAGDQGIQPSFTRFGESAFYEYPIRVDTGELSYTVLTSTTLLPDSWTATRYTFSDVEVTGGTHDLVTVDVETEEDQLFIRLKIDHQPEAP